MPDSGAVRGQVPGLAWVGYFWVPAGSLRGWMVHAGNRGVLAYLGPSGDEYLS